MSAGDFEREAGAPSRGAVREVAAFLADNEKWWLAPIVAALLLLGGLVFLGGTGAAPFIYTLL